ncbi:hypothetical protein LTR12_016062 [Friedmanniomyces endolithicus]|nr:hypothetical protein LTR12_016062 [Friedmanniomyces endolithicus]
MRAPSIIKIPDVEELTESERHLVYQRATSVPSQPCCERCLTDLIRELQYHRELASRLERMRPPVDPQEAAEDQRNNEVKAREELERDGCPPCYPANVDISSTEGLEGHRDGVEYYMISTSEGNEVLPQQLQHWRRFRVYQPEVRDRYGGNFHDYVGNVRTRLRNYNPSIDVTLFQDPARQDRVQDWVEFQDFCIQGHTSTAKKLKKLEETRKYDYHEDTHFHGCYAGWIVND